MYDSVIGEKYTTPRGVVLTVTQRTDNRLLSRMENHYSKPKGFVGRNICISIEFGEDYFGHIVFGSATKHLAGRHEYLGTCKEDLNNIVNNLFYNVSYHSKYPIRNFTTHVLLQSMLFVKTLWERKYGDPVRGFETLVEPPRTGDLYLKAGFVVVGKTKGYTCKRVAGDSVDSWGGRRVWNTDESSLRPKIVLCKKVS